MPDFSHTTYRGLMVLGDGRRIDTVQQNTAEAAEARLRELLGPYRDRFGVVSAEVQCRSANERRFRKLADVLAGLD